MGDHDRGLAFDLETLRRRFLDRRQALRLLGAAGLTPLFGCGSSSNGSSVDARAPGDAGDGDACAPIPTETGGPYPGDGTNGPNALALAGIVRSDIRTSVADASGTAEGVLLTVTLTVVDVACAPLAGRAVYLWHCDRSGDYSMYTGQAEDENYLRGVQETDADGKASFTTVFPACYQGRWPHIHFEIYADLDAATSAGDPVRTSQLALPEAACNEVFATAGYEQSVTNLSRVTLASDGIFRDGASDQIATASGSADAGYTATLTVSLG